MISLLFGLVGRASIGLSEVFSSRICEEMLCQQLPFDDEELEDTGERLLAIRRSQEPLGYDICYT